MPEPLAIPESKFTKWMMFSVSLGLVIAGILPIRKEPIVTILTILNFGPMSYKLFKMAMDPLPRLIFTDEGIEDRNNGLGLVAWKDIEYAFITSIHQNKFINLRLRNEDEYFARLGTWRRRSARINKSMGFVSVSIAMAGLKPKPQELLAMIDQRIG